MLYNQLNKNLFETFGVTFEVSQWSVEKVDRDRAINFGISSDIISSNYTNVMLFVINIGGVFLLCFLFPHCLDKNNLLRFIICH